MDPTILISLGLLSLGGIVALLVSLNRTQAELKEQKNATEDHQNRLFEAGKELERVSALLTDNRLKEACDQFDLTSAKLDELSSQHFSTLEWKTYFDQVKTSKKEMWKYISTNHPAEYRGYLEEKREAENATATIAAKKDIKIFLIMMAVLGAVFLLGLLIAIIQKP